MKDDRRRLPIKVEKPWGYELLYAHTDAYVGKILHIEAGHRLSLQYHRMKDETIYLMRGLLELEVEKGGRMVRLQMNPGESYHIPPGTKHRMKALRNCDILEVSTPQLDDVVRLEDDYGRVDK